MANKLETIRDYAINIGGRMFGRVAWEEAMNHEPNHRYIDRGDIPTWAKNLNIALDHAAPAYATLEILAPVTSRIFVPALKSNNPEYGDILRASSVVVLPLAMDVALWAAILYSNLNGLEILNLKFASNAATHVVLDLGGEAVNKIKSLRPSATTLAV